MLKVSRRTFIVKYVRIVVQNESNKRMYPSVSWFTSKAIRLKGIYRSQLTSS